MIGEVLIVIGAVLTLLSAVGVVRFPDALSRMHALTKASTVGFGLVAIGACLNLTNANDITSVLLAAGAADPHAAGGSNADRALHVLGAPHPCPTRWWRRTAGRGRARRALASETPSAEVEGATRSRPRPGGVNPGHMRW